jgi:MFS family permease
LRTYRQLLGVSAVRRLLAAAALSRVGTAMLALALLLAVVERFGYAVAGAALGAQGVAIAVLAPLGGRLVDRHGRTAVVAAYITAHAVACSAVVAVLFASFPAAFVIIAAAVVGATAPPTAAVTRASWPALVGPGRLQSAYALDSALNSASFVTGPLLVAVGESTAPAVAVLAFAATCRLTGDLVLLCAPLGSEWGLRPGNPRRLGVLAEKAVVLTLGIAALDTFTYGSLQVAAVAAAGAASAPLLVGALAGGELVGGLIYGARAQTGPLRRRLARSHGATVIVLAAFALSPITVAIGAIYVSAGLLSGMRDALNQFVVQAAAPDGAAAETFAWLATAMWAGYGLGTLVSGQLERATDTRAIAMAAALAATGATLLSTRVTQQMPTEPPPG